MARIKKGFCNHYRAMSQHKTCNAGVDYEKFKGPFDDCPCFYKEGQPKPTKCELAAYPTAEEIAMRDAELAKRFEAIGNARAVIVKHLGGPWKRGTPGAGGKIECPNCNGVLAFSRSGYNGHIHAKCATDGCVSWME